MWLHYSIESLLKLSQHHQLNSALPFSLTIIPFLHINPSSLWWVPRVQHHHNMLCVSEATCMHTVRSWFRLFCYPPAVGHPKSQFHYQTHAIRMCGHTRCEMSANVTKATTKVTISSTSVVCSAHVAMFVFASWLIEDQQRILGVISENVFSLFVSSRRWRVHSHYSSFTEFNDVEF